jgi:hypothetical protein
MLLTDSVKVLPDARDLRHLRLAAELAVGADFARDARHLGREDRQLLDHRVDDRRRAQELAFERPALDVEAHGLQQIALRDRGHRAGEVRDRAHEVVDQRVEEILHLAPRAALRLKLMRWRVLPWRPTTWPDSRELLRHLWLADDLVEAVGDLAVESGPVAGRRTLKSPSATADNAERRRAAIEGFGDGIAIATAGPIAARGAGWRFSDGGVVVASLHLGQREVGAHAALQGPCGARSWRHCRRKFRRGQTGWATSRAVARGCIVAPRALIGGRAPVV